MYQFFIKQSQILNDDIVITGADVNHIKNVLRMGIGEKIEVTCKEDAMKYTCEIAEMTNGEIRGRVISSLKQDTELLSKVYLFQGLPKGDKMELIIQKAVELGVFSFIPFSSKRTVVKLDEKKEQGKQRRWQAIAESAAKQAKRAVIPEIKKVMAYEEALAFGRNLSRKLIAYECENDMQKAKEIIRSIKGGESVGIFIGPEGGFEKQEIDMAVAYGAEPISLGKRILRTETAGIALLSVIMFQLET